jgi:hypothetical protein
MRRGWTSGVPLRIGLRDNQTAPAHKRSVRALVGFPSKCCSPAHIVVR